VIEGICDGRRRPSKYRREYVLFVQFAAGDPSRSDLKGRTNRPVERSRLHVAPCSAATAMVEGLVLVEGEDTAAASS